MATSSAAVPVYVLDTHTLCWYWTEPTRLGRAADVALQTAERRQALALVPLIVVLELYYVLRKQGSGTPVGTILRLIDSAPALRIEGLSRQHLQAFDQLDSIGEMRDRLIAAVGLVYGAPIVTRDPAIHACPLVQAVW